VDLLARAFARMPPDQADALIAGLQALVYTPDGDRGDTSHDDHADV
jgi:hypothetical protein